MTLGEEVDHHVLPLDKDSLYVEGNTKYIFPTIPMKPQEPPIVEVETYLDSLVVHSRKRIYYPSHFHLVFDRCKQAPIVIIVSMEEILVDRLKVEAILQLPPSHSMNYV